MRFLLKKIFFSKIFDEIRREFYRKAYDRGSEDEKTREMMEKYKYNRFT